MKRFINYLLLISNTIVSLSAAIVLILFLMNFKSSETINVIFENLKWTIAIPIIGMTLGCIGVGLFFYFFKNLVKNREYPINPRLIARLKLCGIITLANFIVPVTFSIIAILCNKQTLNIILLSLAFGISAFISLIISGLVAYFNLSIGFSELSREELSRLADEENKKQIGHEVVEESENQSDDTSNSVASAGGFN